MLERPGRRDTPFRWRGIIKHVGGYNVVSERSLSKSGLQRSGRRLRVWLGLRRFKMLRLHLDRRHEQRLRTITEALSYCGDTERYDGGPLIRLGTVRQGIQVGQKRSAIPVTSDSVTAFPRPPAASLAAVPPSAASLFGAGAAASPSSSRKTARVANSSRLPNTGSSRSASSSAM